MEENKIVEQKGLINFSKHFIKLLDKLKNESFKKKDISQSLEFKNFTFILTSLVEREGGNKYLDFNYKFEEGKFKFVFGTRDRIGNFVEDITTRPFLQELFFFADKANPKELSSFLEDTFPMSLEEFNKPFINDFA